MIQQQDRDQDTLTKKMLFNYFVKTFQIVFQHM